MQYIAILWQNVFAFRKFSVLDFHFRQGYQWRYWKLISTLVYAVESACRVCSFSTKNDFPSPAIRLPVSDIEFIIFTRFYPFIGLKSSPNFYVTELFVFSIIWTFDNLPKNEKFSSQIKFPKTSLFKTFRQLKVGRRLKYRYPVNRIIWILRVSYNHMIMLAQNIKERATVSSSKLHE